MLNLFHEIHEIRIVTNIHSLLIFIDFVKIHWICRNVQKKQFQMIRRLV